MPLELIHFLSTKSLQQPFHGFSAEQALQIARDARSPKGSGKVVCRGRYFSTSSSSTCSIWHFLDPLTDQVTDTLEGLELDKYVANPWLKKKRVASLLCRH